jgi:hypothetical protein
MHTNDNNNNVSIGAHCQKRRVFKSCWISHNKNNEKNIYVSSKIADSCTNTDGSAILIKNRKKVHVVIANSNKSVTCYHTNSNNFTINWQMTRHSMFTKIFFDLPISITCHHVKLFPHTCQIVPATECMWKWLRSWWGCRYGIWQLITFWE